MVGRKVGDHGVLQRRQDLCGALKNSNANDSWITRRSLWAVAARVSSTKSHPFTSLFSLGLLLHSLAPTIRLVECLIDLTPCADLPIASLESKSQSLLQAPESPANAFGAHLLSSLMQVGLKPTNAEALVW